MISPNSNELHFIFQVPHKLFKYIFIRAAWVTTWFTWLSSPPRLLPSGDLFLQNQEWEDRSFVF